jgi:nitroreductase
MILNDLTSPLALLRSRRTGKPMHMVAPGPSEAQIRDILTVAMRVPDHGKLAPWRFVAIRAQDRGAFEQALVAAYRAEKPQAGHLEVEAISRFATQAPSLVVVFSSVRPQSHIPVWEQELSAGALCQNLLLATHAHGYVGCWLTGWPAYAASVHTLLGGRADERIAGFFFLGTPGEPIEDRPRPDLDAHLSYWSPASEN